MQRSQLTDVVIEAKQLPHELSFCNKTLSVHTAGPNLRPHMHAVQLTGFHDHPDIRAYALVQQLWKTDTPCKHGNRLVKHVSSPNGNIDEAIVYVCIAEKSRSNRRSHDEPTS